MNKTIIGLYGRKGEGKSATLKNVCRQLLTCYPNARLDSKYALDYSGDIFAIIHLGDVKIGIESQGDPNSRLFAGNAIETFAATDQCDIILCASRTSVGKVSTIDNTARQYNYKLIWLSSAVSATLNHEVLNHLCADHIIKLIESLIVGRITRNR